MSGEDGLTGFCSDATITSPYPTDGEARGRHFTHLDTAGRLVVSVMDVFFFSFCCFSAAH
jgi:hypothetical protein